MKKLSILVVTGFMAWPAMILAADHAADQDQVAASSVPQQDEDADDSAVIATPVAPAVAAVGDIHQAPGVSLVAKTVDAMSLQVTELRSEVIELQQQTQQARAQMSKLTYAIYALSGLVILLALLSLAKRRKKPAPVQVPAVAGANGSQTDYDFMASHEAIPAKLDLARAYIAMEDFNAARETLAAVLGEGNEEQRLEAKSLLAKIKY